MGAKILVVGSINMDLVVRAQRFPVAGETLRGEGFKVVPGGKGSNQAVAASRLGGSVKMVGRVGADTFGPTLRKTLEDAGVDATEVKADPNAATGVAFIILDASGQNSIIIAQGANLSVRPEDLRTLEPLFEKSDVLLLQLEIPMESVEAAVKMAKEKDVKVVVDAGPPTPLSDELIKQIDVLSPNETEASALLGREVAATAQDAKKACKELLAKGAGSVVFKLGERGCMIATEKGTERLPSYIVDVVDTTGAGDAFTAALAVALGEGKDLKEASAFASAAGALAVTKFGAQPSMPSRADADKFLANPPKTRD
ncbi:MAG: ribokinase [Armatimonadetes bacterium]|nr:ribokinase [Armatimonadota bacterium]NIM23359.1 ribokinase [Armatimonadota bacterium]NIM67223.1 ribokinase [Armatimonadota bacterium]NIM75742.1 ribokinase [Armatimonadota bacterium]NIN05410.1 ribokinase [Armatimonadota bacterium]